MSAIKTGGPAFPVVSDSVWTEGVTIRDYFAQTQMPLYFGKLAARFDTPKPIEYKQAADLCYRDADAMLKAREVTP
jgi:hypothetical protein